MAKTLTVYLAADLKKFTGSLDKAGGQLKGFSGMLDKVLGPALIGAGVAAGAFATKLAVDGVKSAIEDEAAVAKLATTLSNLGFDAALQPLEAYIAEMELATGIVDNDLRAAFERLIRSTGDVEEAQKALQISVDVSASKGKDLMQVADSLGKAYDGQVTSIQRLGTGISNATILSKDMEAITSELQSLFAGQAQAAAQTYEGQIGRLNVAFENLKESFGTGFLDALGDTNQTTETLMDTFKDLQPAMEAVGESIGTIVEALAGNQGLQDTVVESAGNLGVLAEAFGNVTTAATDAADSASDYSASLPGTTEYSGPLGQARLLIDSLKVLNIWFDSTAEASDFAAGAVMDFSGGLKQGSIAARDAALAAGPAADAIREAGDAADAAGDDAQVAAVKFANLGEAMAAVGGETFNWRKEINGAQQGLEDIVIDRRYEDWLARINAATESNSRSTSGAATATTELAKENKKLTDAYTEQSTVFADAQTALANQVTELENAAQAVTDYANAIQTNLLEGISLEKAYSGQFTKEGELTGISLIEGFNQQIDQAEWFGNVLNAIKAKGADQTLVEEIASLGPGIGGALGQQLLDDGLVPTMSERWSHVQEITAGLADGLVPEFLRAGIESGVETVNGLAEQLSKEGKRLAKLGKKIAKPVGASFKAQLAQDVADAIAQAQAAGTAARAEAYAKEQARQAALTEQAIAQGIANLVRNADQRNGRDLNPVLA